jgi:hypothetical protein
MPAPKPLKPDFHGTPGPSARVLERTARDAGEAADETEPKDAPKRLPAHTYGPIDRKRRGELLDDRHKSLEEQRFNAELDWEMYSAQVESMIASGEATEQEIKSLHDAERTVRLRVISLDAVLVRLGKKKI